MQPPHGKTLEKLITELEEVIDCDRQFISMSEELLYRWRSVAQMMDDRFRTVLGTAPCPRSNSTSTP